MRLIRRLPMSLAALLCAVFLTPSLAQNTDMLTSGKTILSDNCSACHAVSVNDESMHLDAPPFRSLSASYPVEQLAEALVEGIMTGHADMPEFAFSVEEVDAILAWLESIQEQ